MPMQDLPRGKKRLWKALLKLPEEAMLLEELDGFVAGLLVCPEMISPNDWLPFVWNSEGDSDFVFDSLAHANKVMGFVMEHYNDVAVTLFERPDHYAPLFAIDERNDDILWEIWIEGFDRAVKLRPDAWPALENASNRAAEAWRGLKTLADLACTEMRLSEEEYNARTAGAPDNIVGWVRDLNAWRLAQHRPVPSLRAEVSPFAATSGKVGRNEPCPCGSGKKYKRCCGLN